MNIEKMVRIAKNKSLLKEYKTSNNPRTVYLNDGEEFQIQLYNPYDYTISAKITLNGTKMPNELVLRPAERVWLDRYLDNPRKFKFETYEVDNDKSTERITAKNGLINIDFYRVRRPRSSYPTYPTVTTTPYERITWTNTPIFQPETIIRNYYCNSDSSYVSSCTSNTAMDSCTYNTASALSSSQSVPNSIETGRIAEGSYSDQKFNNVDLESEYLSFCSETIKILPLSCKSFSSNDLKKQYCPSCGHKINDKYKFCTYCGENLK